jgi:hypothetical protein
VRGMRQLKKFAVVVWVRKTDAFKAVREQLVSIAEDEPDESTEFEGMVDFHWGFDSHAEAERLANSLREISHKPEIVVLRTDIRAYPVILRQDGGIALQIDLETSCNTQQKAQA